MQFNSNIGKRIQTLRLEKGWSQAYLAEKADIDARNLSRIEIGKAQPKLSTIIALSNALSITPNDILLFEFRENQTALAEELVKLLNSLSPENKRKAIDYINYLKLQD